MPYYLVQDNSDNTKNVVIFSSKEPSTYIAEVPGNISKDDHDYLVMDNGSVIVDSTKKTTGDALKADNIQRKTYSKSYADNVSTEMISVFGTTNQINLLFKYLTWTMMKEDPGFYASKGLEDESGNALDTNTKVYDYANQNIIKAMDYSVYVFEKEKELRDNITSLG